jgi:DNA-binding Lrp family transcriptional regulator
MSQFTIDDKESIKILQIQKLRDKILYILSTNNKVYRFKNVSQFSIKLGVSREALSRELVKLESEGIILKDKNVIRLRS